MEAVPRLPMISFELKRNEGQTVFSQKLQEYIENHYSESGETFQSQINTLEILRMGACRPQVNITGCTQMKRYYCQLNFMMSRFPMGRGGEAAVRFSWKDPYTDVVTQAADIGLELASILHNIGALHSQLGALDNRTTAEGMKMACSHFQCAVWAFQQTVESENGSEMGGFMAMVCLAQAQECFVEKCMLDNRKAISIAKVAVQTVENYRSALKRLTEIENIPGKWKKKWEMYLKFKASYHGSIARLYQGQQAEEEQKSGERVAYYENALERLQEARKLSRQLDNIEAVNEALQFTQDVVEGKLKAAKNENEFVYHEQVPDVATLPEIEGASLAKSTGFSIHDPDISGGDIFAKLIPIKAHITSSMYSERLAELLRSINGQVAQSDHDLDSFLVMLDLEDPSKTVEEFPQQLFDYCAAMNARPDAVNHLQAALETLSNTYRDVEAILTEVRALLDREEKEEMRYEDVVGKRPPSIAATDLTREARKYWDAHTKASESNSTLRRAIEMHSENLKLLMLVPRQLERKIPTVSVDDDDQHVFRQMENLVKKIEEMRTQRHRLVNQLREAVNRDDITQKIVTCTSESKTELFDQEIKKHDTILNHIKMNIAAQENIVAAVQEHYPRFSMARQKLGEKSRGRSSMIQSLIAAYEACDDLMGKSQKGIDFYQKLHSSASKLLQRVKSTCTVQQEERAHILSSIIDSTDKNEKELTYHNNLHQETTNTTPKLKDYLNLQKETGKLGQQGGKSWVPGIRPAPVGSETVEPSSYYPPAVSTAYGYSNTYEYATYPEMAYPVYPERSYVAPTYPAYTYPTPAPQLDYQQYYPYQEYTPQQYQATGFQQGAEYLQYGNSTLYTQTQQQTAYTTPTSSQVYSDGGGQTQPVSEPWSHYSYSSAQIVNSMTYQQADGYPTTSLTSSSSANGIMASPTVASSNVDLLAGLDFDVTQAPLTANPVSPQPVETPVMPQPVVPVKFTEKQNIPEQIVAPVKIEEKLDVDSLKLLAPEVEKLEKLVEGLTVKTLSGPTTLDLKWKEIIDAQEKDSHMRSISVARCYPMKNRFPDILPYDDSRIELPSTKDDYINASLVKPVTVGMMPVILTQSPLPVTYADFWSMVVEQQTELIVCLLSDAELADLGGHCYWPESKTQDLTVGKIRISLQACNSRQYWVERILSVTSLETKITRVVVHLQFTVWPGSTFPTSPAPLLTFLAEVQMFMQQQRNRNHPAVIHCVSGVGRSGLVLLLLAAITDFQAGRGLSDPVALATRINISKKNCLRDREHLKFAYQSILYYAQDLLFKHGILTSRSTFEENAKNPIGKCHTRHPSQDFLNEINQAQAKMENISVTGEKQQQPASLLAALDPNQFNLSPSDTKSKIKFTPEQFTKSSSTGPLASQSSSKADPFSDLDPLWSLKK